MKSFLLILTLLAGLFSVFLEGETPVFRVKMQNGGYFQVFENRDSSGILKGYWSNIIAPVCEDSVCYNVDILFKWNLLGDFVAYETPEKSPLTKLDHIPFTPADNQKLQNILTNHDLIFTGMPAEKLIVKTKKEGIDGYSGATVTTIKEEVIEGALYTCYTLWHIANGPVVDSIRSHTKKLMDDQMIQEVLKMNNSKAHYFLINSLSEIQYKNHLPVILKLTLEGKGYFPKNAFEKIPSHLFEQQGLQEFLIKNYHEYSYYTQMAILKKLQGLQLSKLLLLSLIEQIDERNSGQNQRIVNLVIANADKELLEILGEEIRLKEVNLNSEQRERLEGLGIL